MEQTPAHSDSPPHTVVAAIPISMLAEGREADFYRGASGRATSPNAHRGVDLHLTDALVGWARQTPAWLVDG
jgi:hypothetical protein